MTFIDLFSGLGGFHVALEKLGHKCVFASEKKEVLARLYEENFGIVVNRDISKIRNKDIPKHEILCAGFPCQPFSKAGSQEGLNDKTNGNLFNIIAEILGYHSPDFFILENVRNLEKHDKGRTWHYIQSVLKDDLKYSITSKILSPHQYGIPQHRERFFIIGSKKHDLSSYNWPEPYEIKGGLRKILNKTHKEEFKLERNKVEVLKVWQEFLNVFPKHEKLPSWPIWSMEFGATYPFENKTPHSSSSYLLGRYKGNFGVPLKGMTRDEKFDNLPKYAKTEVHEFPIWKKRFIRNNRAFYEKYSLILDPVIKKIKELNISSHQKFEWNIQGGERNIYNHLIQFRGSGVRIKRANYFPSLVTVRTQTPIIGWDLRYITPDEGAKMQSMPDIKLPKEPSAAYAALGNAVNAKLVQLIMENLLSLK